MSRAMKTAQTWNGFHPFSPIWSVRWMLFMSRMWCRAFRCGDSHPECCGLPSWSPSERFCSLSLESTVVPVGYEAPGLHKPVRGLAEQFLVYLLAVNSRSCSEFCAQLSSLNTLSVACAGVGVFLYLCTWCGGGGGGGSDNCAANTRRDVNGLWVHMLERCYFALRAFSSATRRQCGIDPWFSGCFAPVACNNFLI